MPSSIAKASLTAKPEQRFTLPLRGRLEFARRTWFSITLAVVFLVHAGVVAAFLWRDRTSPDTPVQAEETPVEVVVEPPPPKPEPKPDEKPAPQPPQKQAFEKPATSAPRAQNDSTDEAAKDKETRAPKAATPVEKPAESKQNEDHQTQDASADEKQAETKPAAETKADDKQPDQAEAPKPPEPDKEAEALDREPPPEPPRKPASLRSKPVEKPKQAKAATQVAGSSELPDYTFAKPMRKKFKFAGGTEDDRYLAEVFGMITQYHRAIQAPVGIDWMVAVAFQVDSSGNLVGVQVQHSSGFPTVDAAAIEAVEHAAPFPPPPSGATTGLIARLRSDPHSAMTDPR